jgi:hypothetical protein
MVAATGEQGLRPGMVAVVQTAGDLGNWHMMFIWINKYLSNKLTFRGQERILLSPNPNRCEKFELVRRRLK